MDGRELVLAGRKALVTGAARRIGRAIALSLAAGGADVVVHYRTSSKEAEATAGEIQSLGRRAWTLRGDLADAGQAEALVARAIELAGPIDILINNASIIPRGGIMDLSPADLAENIQVHAMAPLQLSRALAAQGPAGDIVNMLDCRVAECGAACAAYHLSKRMLLAVTRMLALELAPKIKVNAVAPGLILPPPGQDESYLKRHASTNPLGRWGTVEDVAEAACFLVRSEFITGQVIFVDGGRNLKGSVYEQDAARPDSHP